MQQPLIIWELRFLLSLCWQCRADNPLKCFYKYIDNNNIYEKVQSTFD